MFGVYATLGSVSSATHRLEDIIPAYHSALAGLVEELREAQVDENDLLDKVKVVGRMDTLLGEIEKRMEEEDYYESEDATHDLEQLTEELEGFAPYGASFGAHEGDGADFGFWVRSDFLRELNQGRLEDDVVKVGDLGEIDKLEDRPRHVAQVSDHGNVELYELDRNGNYKSLWSIV